MCTVFEVADQRRRLFYEVYMCQMKEMIEYIRFAFITGIS